MSRRTVTVEETDTCPECNSSDLKYDRERGEVVCNNCGLVLDSLIDPGSDRRPFDNGMDDIKGHSGDPSDITVHDKGLSTEISGKNKDVYGKALDDRRAKEFYRLRRIQKRERISRSVDRNLSSALVGLGRLCSVLSLPRKVREDSAYIYRKALNRNIIRGRTIEGVMAASVYASCIRCGVPRTLYEIASAVCFGESVDDFDEKRMVTIRSKRTEIGKTYTYMNRELKINNTIPQPEFFVPRFCTKLGLGQEDQDAVIGMMKELSIQNESPDSIAASFIYVRIRQVDMPIDKSKIRTVTGVDAGKIDRLADVIIRGLNVKIPV